MKPFGQFSDVVAVTEPNIHLARQASEQSRLSIHDGEPGITILATGRRLDFTAQLMSHQLQAIADSQEPDIGLVNQFPFRSRRILVINRRRPSRQNQSFGLPRGDFVAEVLNGRISQ
jgi:hypothetical protein